jgi:hypothetical protein
MAQIIVKLKHGDVVIIIDDGMVEFLKDYYKVFNAKTGYVRCRLKSNKNKSTIPLQRLVANTPKGYFTHHINHDKNDYRLENLEIIEPEKHSHRQEKHKHYNGKPTSSIYIGVTWDKVQQKWYVSL